jgi:thiol-disulfide isomerase/thioredoxin
VSRTRSYLLIALVALTAGLGGYLAQARWSVTPEASGPEKLLRTRLQDLDGHARAPGDWAGKVVVVNFWATWCAPCREEIPLFVDLQRLHGGHGLQLVGIALDDPAKVRPFAREFGINYPVLLGGIDTMEVMRSAGNRAGVLPYTVVFAPDGSVAHTEVGAVKSATLLPLLALLLPPSPR